MLVHKKRSESDAIMVGRRTALLDNPSLTVRNWYGKNPVRIVLDKNLSLPSSLHLLSDDIPTLVFTSLERHSKGHTEYITLDYRKDLLPQVMEELYRRKQQSLLVEGGTRLLQSFIDADLWDEAFIERAGIRLESGVKAPEIRNKISYSVEKHFGVEITHFTNKSSLNAPIQRDFHR